MCVGEQKMLRTDCTDAQADLGLRCSLMVKGAFSHVAHPTVCFLDTYLYSSTGETYGSVQKQNKRLHFVLLRI